jgi:hypothetical protein
LHDAAQGLEPAGCCLCAHLNLLARDRRKQYANLVHYIEEAIAPDVPIILAGDFNDWQGVRVLREAGCRRFSCSIVAGTRQLSGPAAGIAAGPHLCARPACGECRGAARPALVALVRPPAADGIAAAGLACWGVMFDMKHQYLTIDKTML